MKSHSFRPFYYRTLAINAAIFIVLVFFKKSFNPDIYWLVKFLPLAALFINIFGFYVAKCKTSKRNIATMVSLLFGIKFFSYLILALVFILLEKEQTQRLLYIAVLFGTYLLNTLVLFSSVLNYYRQIDAKP